MNSAQRRRLNRKYKHIIEIPNPGFSKNNEIKRWCYDNFGDENWTCTIEYYGIIKYKFSNESHRNWFSLKWLV